jgi:hypothetical protein
MQPNEPRPDYEQLEFNPKPGEGKQMAMTQLNFYPPSRTTARTSDPNHTVTKQGTAPPNKRRGPFKEMNQLSNDYGTFSPSIASSKRTSNKLPAAIRDYQDGSILPPITAGEQTLDIASV